MALTALIGLLAIGVSARQEPIQVSIETKIYKYLTKSVQLQGKRIKVSFLSKMGTNQIHTVSGVDLEKLTKDKHIKLVSSPVIRTLDGKEAKLSMLHTSASVTEECSTTYTPYVGPDGQIQLDTFLKVESGEDQTRNWSFSTKPTVKQDEPYVILVTRKDESLMYVIKTHVVAPDR